MPASAAPSDEELMLDYAAGDATAFDQLYSRHKGGVYRYMLRQCSHGGVVEELFQDVWTNLIRARRGYTPSAKFTTWLFQVTKNRVLDELRAVERRPRALVALDDIAPLEVLDTPVEQLEEMDALWRAIEDLSVDLKMALLLRDVVGLSYTEIADSLEITLATVKWRIYKAREEVQLALAREGITFATRPAVAEPLT